jgi:hypothetical protein
LIDAVDDISSTEQDNPLTIDVLLNDSNFNSIAFVTQPVNGQTSIVDSKIKYVPDLGFSGTDLFTYSLVDSQGVFDTATVKVDVIGSALNIGLICGDSSCSNLTKDVPLKNHLQNELGHIVTTINDDNTNKIDFSKFDVIVTSESVSSSKTASLKNAKIGILTVEGVHYDELQMAKSGDSSQGNKYVQIRDFSHYITQDFEQTTKKIKVASSDNGAGYMEYWNENHSEVKSLVDYYDSKKSKLLVVEVGDNLYNGDKASERRAFYGAQLFTNLNENGVKLFDRSLEWVAHLD